MHCIFNDRCVHGVVDYMTLCAFANDLEVHQNGLYHFILFYFYFGLSNCLYFPSSLSSYCFLLQTSNIMSSILYSILKFEAKDLINMYILCFGRLISLEMLQCLSFLININKIMHLNNFTHSDHIPINSQFIVIYTIVLLLLDMELPKDELPKDGIKRR
ncbi:calcium-dependent protein kinase 9 [Iris pallida]|uniref:Calcium-dependent protein kinase 9 n=1 Tax=Iris pallida TaxID=29817 RepID=A0AAX6HW34_IRIPA|nr:calcium-dependent protein kinase 9 [Iris pallida]